MELIDIVAEDFINYKKPAMLLEFPYCSFKCDKEFGSKICQNSNLVKYPKMSIYADLVVRMYLENKITESVVFQGLEPFDSFDDMLEFINKFRAVSLDDIVIYTGYTENEISEKLNQIKKFPNIIVKFGRYQPGQNPHMDNVLKVKLMSDNQYAKKIS